MEPLPINFFSLSRNTKSRILRMNYYNSTLASAFLHQQIVDLDNAIAQSGAREIGHLSALAELPPDRENYTEQQYVANENMSLEALGRERGMQVALGAARDQAANQLVLHRGYQQNLENINTMI